MRVEGRKSNLKDTFASQHSAMLHSVHLVTRLVIHTEHLHPHALNRHYHSIDDGQRAVHFITHACVTCHWASVKPHRRSADETIALGKSSSRVGLQ